MTSFTINNLVEKTVNRLVIPLELNPVNLDVGALSRECVRVTQGQRLPLHGNI